MSKPHINFRYNNTSPRSISQIQKGPIKLNNLVESLENPQYEKIILGSSQLLKNANNKNSPLKKKNDQDTSILDKLEKQIKQESQFIFNTPNIPVNDIPIDSKEFKPLSIRLKQFQPVFQDPVETDFIEKPKNKKPENHHSPQEEKAYQEKKNKEKDINPKRQEELEPKSPQKPKYTFAIVPPKQQKKPVCCNIFGLCQKKKQQRTYPIQE